MTTLRKIKWGGQLIIWGVFFALAQTWYFGWNKHPQSNTEAICDAISICIVLLGNILVIHGLLEVIKMLKKQMDELLNN